MSETEPEVEILPASLGTGRIYRAFQRWDIVVIDGHPFYIDGVEDGSPTGAPILADQQPSQAEVERRRALARESPYGTI